MLNAMMIQLYQPLNFMGMVYREVRQAVIDIDMMFEHSGASPTRSRTAPDAPGAERHGGRAALRERRISPTIPRGNPARR